MIRSDMSNSDSSLKIVFSDIDGTLVHYPKDFKEYASIVSENSDNETALIKYFKHEQAIECIALKSLTGGTAYISKRTLLLIKELQSLGVLFTVITGARSSTYFNRRHVFKNLDYEFFENGGRMFAKGHIDYEYTMSRYGQVIGSNNHSRASRGEWEPEGKPLETLLPAEQRNGLLWDTYRHMSAQGWVLDARDYLTNFRVILDESPGKTEVDLTDYVRNFASQRGLTSSYNLGKADIYPANSGKANSASYLLDLLNLSPLNAFAMFDDDNDIELGELCSRGFLPGVTHSSVLAALKRNPHWTISKESGFLGTEEALEKIIAIKRAQIELSGKKETIIAVSSATG